MSRSTQPSYPQGDEALLEAAFAAWPMLGSLSLWKISVLTGGIANRSWLLEGSASKLVLRLPVSDTRVLGVDRVAEYAALAAAVDAGLAPPLIDFDVATGRSLAEFVQGRIWNRVDAHDANCVRRLAARLKELHALAPPAAARRLDYAELLPSYRRSLDDRVPAAPRASGAFDNEADRRLAALASEPQPQVLCHNDVHRRNIVDGQRLWLIDWEYAAIGDGQYDLASFACYHDLDGDERRALLEAYDARESQRLARRFDNYCWLFDYMHLLWLELTASGVAERGSLLLRLKEAGKL